MASNNERADLENIVVNLYEILALNKDAVRELTKDQQDAVIEKAYQRLLTFRSCEEIEDSVDPVQLAHDVLTDSKKRASYNNLLHFNHGFFRRWKAILCPEDEAKSRAVVSPQLVIKLLKHIGKAIVATLPDIVATLIGKAIVATLPGIVATLIGKAIVATLPDIVATLPDIVATLRLNKFLIIFRMAIFVTTEVKNFLQKARQDFISEISISLGDELPRLKRLSMAKMESSETEPQDRFHLKYVSRGAWVSRMVVSYSFLDTQMRQIAWGSGNTVTLPVDCSNIRVHFEIMRFPFVWCDLKKWSRYKEDWEKTGEAHVFEYPESVGDRTFTIGGRLYFEKVLKVTNKMNDGVGDM